MKIAIVDYGLANIRSVINAIECFNLSVTVAENGHDLNNADKIILPGVGAFDAGMKGLHERGHVNALNENVIIQKKPCLGICLGFQFLFSGSEEGQAQGLGWLQGQLRLFDRQHLKVPHMGWNALTINENSQLFSGIAADTDVYFVHSYYAPVEQDAEKYAAAYCEYGTAYVAAIEKEHIFGVQFHPEKSQLAGMKMLENFLRLA